MQIIFVSVKDYIIFFRAEKERKSRRRNGKKDREKTGVKEWNDVIKTSLWNFNVGKPGRKRKNQIRKIKKQGESCKLNGEVQEKE